MTVGHAATSRGSGHGCSSRTPGVSRFSYRVNRGRSLPQPKVSVEASGIEIDRPDVVCAVSDTSHTASRQLAVYSIGPSWRLSILGSPFARATTSAPTITPPTTTARMTNLNSAENRPPRRRERRRRARGDQADGDDGGQQSRQEEISSEAVAKMGRAGHRAGGVAQNQPRGGDGHLEQEPDLTHPLRRGRGAIAQTTIPATARTHRGRRTSEGSWIARAGARGARSLLLPRAAAEEDGFLRVVRHRAQRSSRARRKAGRASSERMRAERRGFGDLRREDVPDWRSRWFPYRRKRSRFPVVRYTAAVVATAPAQITMFCTCHLLGLGSLRAASVTRAIPDAATTATSSKLLVSASNSKQDSDTTGLDQRSCGSVRSGRVEGHGQKGREEVLQGTSDQCHVPERTPAPGAGLCADRGKGGRSTSRRTATRTSTMPAAAARTYETVRVTSVFRAQAEDGVHPRRSRDVGRPMMSAIRSARPLTSTDRSVSRSRHGRATSRT